jgi:DNA-binding response OmpR family regulator
MLTLKKFFKNQNKKMRLLVIENDLILLDLLLSSLLKNHLVDVTSSLFKIENLLKNNSYQAILLSSFVFCDEQLRNRAAAVFQHSQSPVLLMTSGELSKHDFVFLGQRSVDFLHKPFSVNELNLRLDLLLFRLSTTSQTPSLNNQKLLLNNQTRSVSCAQETMFLTKKEFCLLQLFFKRPNQLLSKSLLANLVWDDEEIIYGNTIETHIASLRKKIRQISKRELIKTVRGDGYLLEDLK